MSTSPVYVGEGLTPRTYEECLALGLNPNPNPAGRIILPQGEEGKKKMREHIIASQAWALQVLQD